MTPEKMVGRIRAHILHPGKWTHYWVLMAFAKLGFGITNWPTVKAAGGQLGDRITRHTTMSYVNWPQRFRILIGGVVVYRLTCVHAKGNDVIIGASTSMSVMPPKWIWDMEYTAETFNKVSPPDKAP